MLRRSAEHNRLSDRITVINGDLRNLGGLVEFGSFDMAAMNPPYKIGGGGIVNPDRQKQGTKRNVRSTISLRLPQGF